MCRAEGQGSRSESPTCPAFTETNSTVPVAAGAAALHSTAQHDTTSHLLCCMLTALTAGHTLSSLSHLDHLEGTKRHTLGHTTQGARQVGIPSEQLPVMP